MRELLDALSYQQLLAVAREYNKQVSVPIPSGVLKKDLVEYILKHAKDAGKLLSVLSSVKKAEPKITLPKVKVEAGMTTDEVNALERRKARFERRLERAKLIYEPIEGDEMSKADAKAYKAKVKEIKEAYKRI